MATGGGSAVSGGRGAVATGAAREARRPGGRERKGRGAGGDSSGGVCGGRDGRRARRGGHGDGRGQCVYCGGEGARQEQQKGDPKRRAACGDVDEAGAAAGPTRGATTDGELHLRRRQRRVEALLAHIKTEDLPSTEEHQHQHQHQEEAAEEMLLGGMQIGFVLFSLMYSLSAMKYWKRRLALLCTSSGGHSRRSAAIFIFVFFVVVVVVVVVVVALFLVLVLIFFRGTGGAAADAVQNLCRALTAQLSFVPPDFFASDLTQRRRSDSLGSFSWDSRPSSRTTTHPAPTSSTSTSTGSALGTLREEQKRLLQSVRDKFGLFLESLRSSPSTKAPLVATLPLAPPPPPPPPPRTIS